MFYLLSVVRDTYLRLVYVINIAYLYLIVGFAGFEPTFEWLKVICITVMLKSPDSILTTSVIYRNI